VNKMSANKNTKKADWRRFFENDYPIKNKAGISESGIDSLVRDFDFIGSIKPDYPARILRFVLDGDDEDLLPELELLDIYFKAKHFAPRLKDKNSREKLFKESSLDNHDFLERLGRIYHALANPLNPNFLMPARYKSPSWLEALLLHASGSYTGDMRTYLQLKIIEDLLVASGQSPTALVEAVFEKESFDYSSCEIIVIFFSLIDFHSIVDQHREPVKKALINEKDSIRLKALSIICTFGLNPEPFAESIAQKAIYIDPNERKIAQKIIRTHLKFFFEILKTVIQKSADDEKIHGVRFLSRLYGERAFGFLENLMSGEVSEKVKKSIETRIGSEKK